MIKTDSTSSMMNSVRMLIDGGYAFGGKWWNCLIGDQKAENTVANKAKHPTRH